MLFYSTPTGTERWQLRQSNDAGQGAIRMLHASFLHTSFKPCWRICWFHFPGNEQKIPGMNCQACENFTPLCMRNSARLSPTKGQPRAAGLPEGWQPKKPNPQQLDQHPSRFVRPKFVRGLKIISQSPVKTVQVQVLRSTRKKTYQTP